MGLKNGTVHTEVKVGYTVMKSQKDNLNGLTLQGRMLIQKIASETFVKVCCLSMQQYVRCLYDNKVQAAINIMLYHHAGAWYNENQL